MLQFVFKENDLRSENVKPLSEVRLLVEWDVPLKQKYIRQKIETDLSNLWTKDSNTSYKVTIMSYKHVHEKSDQHLMLAVTGDANDISSLRLYLKNSQIRVQIIKDNYICDEPSRANSRLSNTIPNKNQ